MITHIVTVEVNCAYINHDTGDVTNSIEVFSFPISSDFTGIDLTNYAQAQAQERLDENETLLGFGIEVYRQ